MYSVPFYKPAIGQEELDEVADCLRNGWLTTGPKVKQFEADFAAYSGLKHAVALNSCTAALHLALEAIGVRAGDRVVVPTMTFAATAEVVRYFNAVPLLVDSRLDDLNIDVADARRRIEVSRAKGEKVFAIIPVHYAGQIGDVTGIKALADDYGLKIVEDAAHCCPAYYRDHDDAPWQGVGSFSEISCFSFYANKPICTGEGGMACTNRDDYEHRMRIMSLHGISRDAWKRFSNEGSWQYEITAPGYKYNLTDIAAAIGLHQLRKADRLHAQRTRWAELYSESLANVDELVLPKAMPNRIHSWHLYCLRLRPDRLNISRNEVIAELKNSGVSTSVHWMPLHMHPYYRDLFGFTASEFPCAASAFSEMLSLPLYPTMTEQDVEYVCSALKSILAKARPLVRGWKEQSAIPA